MTVIIDARIRYEPARAGESDLLALSGHRSKIPFFNGLPKQARY